jgi:hypothetical protein
MILRHFDRGQKLTDNSNRYEHTCKRCGERYPKGRSDALINHILKKCNRISADDRKKAFIEHGNLPDDGSYFLHGQLPNGAGPGEVPNGENGWNGLELLAEVSRAQVLDHPHNNGRHAPINQLQLAEHFTPSNPPLSFEQRASREKSSMMLLLPPHTRLTLTELDQPKRISNIQLEEHLRDDAMDITYTAMPAFSTGDGGNTVSNHGLPDYHNMEAQLQPGHFVPSRSSSPNFSMAQRATTIAQAAAANFAPSMVDPNILRDEAALNARNQSAAAERLLAQHLQEENARMPDVPQSHTPEEDEHSQHMPSWAEDEVVDEAFSEHHRSVQPSVEPQQQPPPVELPVEIAYRPIAMGSETAPAPVASMTGAFSAEPGDGARHNSKQKVRGAFTGQRRVEVQEVRKQGACIRCKILKKSCSLGTPCKACASVDSARLWKQPCSRKRLLQEMDMFSAGLHHTLMSQAVGAEKEQVQFRFTSVQIEASHHPDANIFASFPVFEGLAPEAGQIDPSLDRNPSQEVVYLIDTEHIDIGPKVDAYTKQMRDVFFQREPSNFIRTTLGYAVNVLTELKKDKEFRFLSDALDLWCMVHILVDHEVKWVLTKKTSPDSPPDTTPVNDRSWRLINAQLSATVEKKAALLTKSVLQAMEVRLQSPTARKSFELFLVGILILNCLEKTTWFFNSYEKPPLENDWPLEREPILLANQGESVTNMLNMLLRIKGVGPTMGTTNEGLLRSDYREDYKKYFQEVNLTGMFWILCFTSFLDHGC